jgi:carboxyl-terminal processing protease
MKKRIIYIVTSCILGLNLIWGAKTYLQSVQAAEKSNIYQNIETFVQVLEKVHAEYVDSDKVGYKDLIYGALKGMLNTLDPHSEFMEPQKYDELKKDTRGAFGGVGIIIGPRDNFLTVIAPIEDTPAFNAGILSGDRVIKINGNSTEKLTLEDAVKQLRGEPGTTVTITIMRPSSGMIKDIKLTRAVIKVDTVKDINGKREFPLNEDKIGYIRLTQFGEQTSSDLESALRKLESQGMRALILDLRGNPGGLLDQAVEVCGKFVPKGQLIVSTEGRDPSKRIEYRLRSGGKHTGYPMVVLVNNGSASASEIVAGCLQDLKRAIIVGDQTFGKGSVQSIFPLTDGSALRLTTAKYYTPSHKVIHEKGITPDIEVRMTPEEEEALYLKRSPGGNESVEMLDPKRKEFVKSVRDTQLERAIDLLKGVLLYSSRSVNMNYAFQTANK